MMSSETRRLAESRSLAESGDVMVGLMEGDTPPKYEDIARANSRDTTDGRVEEISVHFKQVPESAVEICDCDQEVTSEKTQSGSGSFGSDIFNSFNRLHNSIGAFIDAHKTILRWLLIGTGVALAVGYFTWALVISIKHDCQDPAALVALVTVIFVCAITWLVRRRFCEQLTSVMEIITAKLHGSPSRFIGMGIIITAVLGIVLIIVSSVWRQPSNLVALGGMAFFLAFLWIFSAHPAQVQWRPVVGGLCLQFYFAVIILKWDFGYRIFHWLGQRAHTFLNFTDYGSEFVFGPKYTDHIFAMKVLPVVVFFSCAINVLYYIGAMQIIIAKIGWLLRLALRTTAPESLCAAANIFVGLSEAPIVVRPFMSLMTKSELNAIMTSGFATISGSVMAAYISFGVPPEHLLCASVMNAPCALAVSKLLYPETENSRLRKASDIDISGTRERNILEAAAAGAAASIKLVANIAANLIAFLAMLAFVNALLSWFGGFVCHPELSFQVICSYVFMPVAYLMGVEWRDAGVVGELIGIKTFLNEFVAYKELATFMDSRAQCTGQLISVRSQVIATYALCGFSNLTAIGVQLGGLGAMAPNRRGDLAEVVLRSLLGGIVVCLMTASVAGLLLVDMPVDQCNGLLSNTTIANSTVTMATNIAASIATTENQQNLTYLVNSTMAAVSFGL